jgi:purine-binding chemotaxis protein CheW
VRSGADVLGIPIAQVREVVRPVGVRPVPGAPVIQAGIVNVRGAIVTVLDLQALRTGVRAVTPGSIVLLSYGSRMLGLAVDAVHDVRVMDDEAVAPGAGPAVDLPDVMPLDAVALCARYMHSVEERER